MGSRGLRGLKACREIEGSLEQKEFTLSWRHMEPQETLDNLVQFSAQSSTVHLDKNVVRKT